MATAPDRKMFLFPHFLTYSKVRGREFLPPLSGEDRAMGGALQMKEPSVRDEGRERGGREGGRERERI